MTPISPSGLVLDLACGSAPVYRVWREVSSVAWVGVDRSAAELARARQQGASPLVRADASQLPFSSGVFEVVVCSMAIMLLQPLESVLAEIHRVLRPKGTGVLTLPGSWPLHMSELLRYGRLMVALRRTHLSYPNDRRIVHLARLLRLAGFEVAGDARRRFAYPLADKASARRFVGSLYLPAIPNGREARASRVAERWVGSEIGIPLRRVIVRAK
ncbi:MAG: class I SAM-dependent methyltransferase [Acidimicrobiales bacterium]